MGEDRRAPKVEHAPEGLPSHHLLSQNSGPSFLTLESVVLTTLQSLLALLSLQYGFGSSFSWLVYEYLIVTIFLETIAN